MMLRIHREIFRLRIEKAAATTEFDSLMMGLVLFDHLGSPIYMNPVAESILVNHPAIEKIDNQIIPSRHEDAVKLRQLVVTCLGQRNETQSEMGGDGASSFDSPQLRSMV